MPLTNGIVDGVAAVRKESKEDKDKYAEGWERIFGKKKICQKKKQK